VYTESDPFYSQIDFDSDCLASRRVPELLRDNEELVKGLKPDKPGFDFREKRLSVREYQLRDLHTMLRLHDLLEASPPHYVNRQVQISFISQDALTFWFKMHPSRLSVEQRAELLKSSHSFQPLIKFQGLKVARMDPSRAAGFIATEATSSSPSPAPPSRASSVTNVPRSSSPRTRHRPVIYRFCNTLWDALHGAHQLSVLNLPNLLWWGRFANIEELRNDVRALLDTLQHFHQQSRAVQLFPPFAFDDLLEVKNLTYDRFKAIMLPTIWRPLQSLNKTHIQLLAQHLSDGLPPGRYVLKGSYADAHNSTVTNIVIQPADQQPPDEIAPGPLVEAIGKMSDEMNQISFGLQPFVPSLRLSEYRHWVMAHLDDDGQRNFRLAVTIRTSYTGPEHNLIGARNSIPIDRASIACYDLVQSILHDEQYAGWRQHLLDAGCFAFRIDCGYDDRPGVIPRAFLNEFAAPTDSMFFNHAHESELVWALGRFVAEGLVQRMWSP